MARRPQVCSWRECERSLAGRRVNTRYCSDSCRAKAARFRNQSRASKYEPSPSPSASDEELPDFVEVQVSAPMSPLQAGLNTSSAPHTSDIEVLLSGGYRLKIPRDFDIPTLQRLVLALETLPC